MGYETPILEGLISFIPIWIIGVIVVSLLNKLNTTPRNDDYLGPNY